MEEKVNQFKEALEEIFGEGQVIMEGLQADMVPVPEERYKELLRKEVELDLIYAFRAKDHSYSFDNLIDTLVAMRSPEKSEEPDDAE